MIPCEEEQTMPQELRQLSEKFDVKELATDKQNAWITCEMVV